MFEDEFILSMIEPNSSVIDLGCGDGRLMQKLEQSKNARCQGVEIDEELIYDCVKRGLNVFLDDLDSGLDDYRDKSFDYVILNQSLQQLKRPDIVLNDAFRIGRKVIIGFPNFAILRARIHIFFRGRVPIVDSMPYNWFESPNLHFLSVYDFSDYCHLKNISILDKKFFKRDRLINYLPNLRAETAIFLTERL